MYVIRERLFRLGEDSDITDEAYEITLGSKDVAEVRKHLLTPVGERFAIEVRGTGEMEINGDLLDHEFTIGRDGQTVATISRR
jgi:uncharacterized protein YxjI